MPNNQDAKGREEHDSGENDRLSFSLQDAPELMVRPDEFYTNPGYSLLEDIAQRVLPLHGSRKFEVCLSPPDTTLEEMLCEVFRRKHYRQGLTAAYSRFAWEATWLILKYGRALYEIVRPRLQPPANVNRRFTLCRIPAKGCYKLGSWYVQVLPPKRQEPKRRRLIWIPKKKVWELRLPGELSSAVDRWGLRFSLRNYASRYLDWPLREARPGEQRSGYDFKTHRFALDVALARATRKWGWPGRRMWFSSGYSTEYHLFYRQLRFARSLAIVRAHMLSETNKLLVRLGFPNRLEVSGLPTVKDVDAALEKMSVGEWDFLTAWKAVCI